MIPGCSLNCRRTSCTTVPAERPTALMASDENKNATDPPMSSPMKTVGFDTLICVCGSSNSFDPVACRPSCDAMVSTNEPNSDTDAITAEPMATPLVMALVVLPTASRLTMMRSASPENSPDISATPAALSDTGPKLSSDTTMPAVESMPIPVSETRYKVSSMLPWASPTDTAMATAMAMIAHTVDSSPSAIPDSTAVAGPVRVDSAISLTGPRSVDVKCSVIWLATSTKMTPVSTA